MTDGNPEQDAPDAATRERMQVHLEERARCADERDRVADERDRIADERDQIADERDRIADVRAWQLSQARAPRPGDAQRQGREMLTRVCKATERAGGRDCPARSRAGAPRRYAASRRRRARVRDGA